MINHKLIINNQLNWYTKKFYFFLIKTYFFFFFQMFRLNQAIFTTLYLYLCCILSLMVSLRIYLYLLYNLYLFLNSLSLSLFIFLVLIKKVQTRLIKSEKYLVNERMISDPKRGSGPSNHHFEHRRSLLFNSHRSKRHQPLKIYSLSSRLVYFHHRCSGGQMQMLGNAIKVLQMQNSAYGKFIYIYLLFILLLLLLLILHFLIN